MFNSFPQPKPDSGGSNMKSYQSGATNWNDTNLTKDITISPVSTATSGAATAVRVTITPTGNASDLSLPAATLINATTVRLTRNTGSTAIVPVYIFWEVFEFQNVKSKQTGQSALANGTTSVSVSSVNAQKSILFATFTYSAAGDSTAGAFNAAYRTVNSTTLNFLTTSSAFTAYWQLLEFN